MEGKSKETKTEGEEQQNSIFDSGMRAQLEHVFSRMENNLVLKLYLDNQAVSLELLHYVENLVAMTDKLTLQVVKEHQEKYPPCVKLYRGEDFYTGLAFHGVPGGHEFTSFVLGMYNAAGPGQLIEEEVKKRIQKIQKTVDIKILVTLSCSMCPDLVVAAQHLAAVSDNITTEVFDVRHFESLGRKYNVMSVPCMVINDEHVFFGKKNMQQVLAYIEEI